MLNTLLKSETDVLLELAEKYETLTYLHHWLIKATEGKIVVKYITHILKVLSRFPISFELLRKTSIGMTIGKLSKKKLLDPEKKLLDPGIIKISKELIKSWKQDIKQKKNQIKSYPVVILIACLMINRKPKLQNMWLLIQPL